MRYDVDVVAVPATAAIVIPGPAPLGELALRLRHLHELAAAQGLVPAGRPMARFHDREWPPPAGPVAYDVLLPVVPDPDDSVPDRVGEATGTWLPLHHVLETVHYGPHEAMHDAYAALFEACAAVGYTPSGPVTEVYERGPADGVAPQEYVTRLRLPYAR